MKSNAPRTPERTVGHPMMLVEHECSVLKSNGKHLYLDEIKPTNKDESTLRRALQLKLEVLTVAQDAQEMFDMDSRLLFLMISLLFSCTARADEPCPVQSPAPTDAELYQSLQLDQPSTRPMLYGISKGNTHSWLFGTTHLGPPLIHQLPPQVVLALRRSKSLLVEAIPSRSSQGQWQKISTSAESNQLAELLGPDLYIRYQQLATQAKVDNTRAAQLKPWAAMLAIGSPPNRGMGLDQQILMQARSAGVEITAMQSLTDIAASLDSLPHADQLTMLKDTICQAQSLPQYLRQLARLYVKGNPALIRRFSHWGREEDPVFTRFDKAMVEDRNADFLPIMLDKLTHGRAFISVGAEHLPGPTGLIQQLRQQGYSVTPE